MRSADLSRARRRLQGVQAVLLLAFAGLAVRAGHLSVIDLRGLERGLIQTGRAVRIPPHRGLILDRNGAELALTLEAPSVYASPATLGDRDATARELARALDLEVGATRARLALDSPFVYVARWVSREQADRVRDLALPGVGVVHEPRRIYPYRAQAAQVLGFANIDGEGVRGIEQQEDGWLRGTARRIPVERDNRGRLLFPSGVDPRLGSGGDVALTLDAVLQADAEKALDEALAETRAGAGVVVTLDPRSGEILALAERPAFDPNRFREVSYADTRSRAFLDAVEPGSTLKAFLVAGALERGAIRPDAVLDCEEHLRVPGKTIRDRRPFGPLDVAGVLRVSSNVGAARIAQALGPEDHFAILRRFGFGRSTASGFPDESSGLLRPWRKWRPVDHATIAFGQGVSVTAVQLAAATAALANEGRWIRPSLVTGRRRPGQTWIRPDPSPIVGVVSASTAAQVLRMMEGVVGPEGTGHRAALRGVRVAGKTGTAQKLDRETGTYASDRYLAWFVGVVPADDPRLAIVVMLDEPRGDAHTGGAAAAPVFAQIATRQLRTLGIVTEPSFPEVRMAATRPEVSTGARVPARPAPPRPGTEPTRRAAAPRRPPPVLASAGGRLLLPDFLGLTPDEVRRIADGSPLRVELLGSGRAVAQEPDPGTILAGASARVRVRFAEGG